MCALQRQPWSRCCFDGIGTGARLTALSQVRRQCRWNCMQTRVQLQQERRSHTAQQSSSRCACTLRRLWQMTAKGSARSFTKPGARASAFAPPLTQRTVISRDLAIRATPFESDLADAAHIVLLVLFFLLLLSLLIRRSGLVDLRVPPPGRDGVVRFDLDLHRRGADGCLDAV